MQSGVAICALYAEPGSNIANIKIMTFMKHDLSSYSLLYEVTGGNLVDGLPPAASNNGGVGFWVASWTKTMCGKSGLQTCSWR